MSTVFKRNNFITKANKKHNNRYTYERIDYINQKTKVNITCKIHNLFLQTPKAHLQGQGCMLCRNRLTTKDFITKANKKHNNRYDYSQTVYISSDDPVKIICKKHGIFEQAPKSHIIGKGCNICGGTNKNEFTGFVQKSKITHGNKYDYSSVIYKNNKTKVDIICKIHGKFEQIPKDHIRGKGCYKCKASKGETSITNYLDKLNIKYQTQYSLNKTKFRYDFYLPELNILIVYDGIQHFKAIGWFGGATALAKQKERDRIKTNLASINNIPLIRIPYTRYKVIDEYLEYCIKNLYKYNRDGIYFKTFLDLCKHYQLPQEATPRNYLKYLG